MKTGEIVLVPFPFSELTNIMVRPAVVISATKDKYEFNSICNKFCYSRFTLTNEIRIEISSVNNLRIKSVIKVDRM